MSRNQRRSGRLVATAALAAVVLSGGPAPLLAGAQAEQSASLSGRIFLSDASTPVTDAVVKAFQRGSQEVFQSGLSAADGSYSLALDAGEYDLGIDTRAGIYLVAGTMKVDPGQNRAASFALKPDVSGDDVRQPAEGRVERPEQTPSDPNQPPKPPGNTQDKQANEKKKLKRPRASGASNKTLLVSGVVVGGAIVIGALAKGVSNDGDGSPNR